MTVNNILSAISPETLVYAIKSNPAIVQMAMHKFESYKAFANDLSDAQQVAISANLYKLKDFFNSDAGKSSVCCFADEFINFVNKKA